MLEHIKEYDTAFFLYLNGLHDKTWDPWMIRFTGEAFWIWFFILILFAIFWYNREKGMLNVFLWVIVPLVVSVVLSDHTASSLFKPLVGRLRPCKEISISHLVHFPAGCGGNYGFFSSHASTSFTVAGFVLFSLPKGFRSWSLPVFLWACLFSYSRIYLGKHYPLDIFFGAICGIGCAMGVQYLRDKLFWKLNGFPFEHL